MTDRLRVVSRWGMMLSIAAAVALLPVVCYADDPCTKGPDLWLPPDGTPGLAGGGISVQKTTGDVCQGEKVTITVTVDNLSCGDAHDFDVTVTYDAGTKLIGTQHIDELPGCEYVVLVFEWDTTGVPTGEYDIEACADSGGTVVELNEHNNCLTIDTSLWVRPYEPLIEVEKTDVDVNGAPVYRGDMIRYEAILYNEGCADLVDGPEHEFTDALPAGVTPTTTIAATSGTAAFEGDIVVWDGGIPAGGSVTITYRVTVDNDIEIGETICNQAVARWDGNGDGTYESEEPSDDPDTPAEDDPTCFEIEEEPEGPIPLSGTIDAPTLSQWGMILLGCLMALAYAWRLIRRRAAAA